MKYFNKTTFHRVVPDFIIQGGNSDRYETAKKRSHIGKYLLPPDTKKGYKHHKDRPKKLENDFISFSDLTDN